MVALALSAVVQTSCSQECTLLYCEPGTFVSLELVRVTRAEAVDLVGATVTICHDQTCTSGPVPVPPEPGGLPAVAYFEDAVHTSAGCSWQPSATDELTLFGGYIGADRAFQNGDTFAATLVASDGTVIADHAWTGTFIEYYANGEDCDDHACTQTVLEVLR